MKALSAPVLAIIVSFLHVFDEILGFCQTSWIARKVVYKYVKVITSDKPIPIEILHNFINISILNAPYLIAQDMNVLLDFVVVMIERQLERIPIYYNNEKVLKKHWTEKDIYALALLFKKNDIVEKLCKHNGKIITDCDHNDYFQHKCFWCKMTLHATKFFHIEFDENIFVKCLNKTKSLSFPKSYVWFMYHIGKSTYECDDTILEFFRCIKKKQINCVDESYGVDVKDLYSEFIRGLICNGDLVLVKHFLDEINKNLNISNEDHSFESYLKVAIKYGHENLVYYFCKMVWPKFGSLANGANYAIENGHIDIASNIISAGNLIYNRDYYDLGDKCKVCDRIFCVCDLNIDNNILKSNFESNIVWRKFIKKFDPKNVQQLNILKAIFRAYTFRTHSEDIKIMLCYVILYKNIDLFEMLCSENLCIDDLCGFNEIHKLIDYACYLGKSDIIEYLFKNYEYKFLNTWSFVENKDKYLIEAIKSKKWVAIQFFINKCMCDWNNVMKYCIINGVNEYIIQYLNNHTNIDKNKAMIVAIEHNNNTIAKYFAIHGANDWIQALAVAKKNVNNEMIEYFEKKVTV